MKKSNKSLDLGKVYQDIMSINITGNDSFKSSLDKFYEVMRKHGICQGEWTENGSRRVCNPEWTLCYSAYKQHKILAFDIFECLNTPPDDLLAYNKE